MKYRMAVLALSWILASSAASAGEQELIPSDRLAHIDHYKYWQLQLPLQQGETVRRVFLVGEHVYAVTDRATLFAVHADVGTLRWSAQIPGSWTRVFRPTHTRSFWGKDITLVSAADRLLWLDRRSGETIFDLESGTRPATSAVSDGVRAYFVGTTQHERRLVSELRCLQLVPTGEAVRAVDQWRVRTQGLSTSAPELWGGAIYYAGHDGRVRAAGAQGKERLWVFRVDSPVKGDIHVDSTGVYFGSSDRSIYKLDVETGRLRWRFRTPGEIISKPVIVGEVLHQVVEGVGMFAVTTDTGRQLWRLPDVRKFVSSAKGRTHLLTRQGDILSVDVATGDVKVRVLAPDVGLVAENPRSGAMYLAGADGRLMCAQHKDVPYLRFEQVQAKQELQAEAAKPGRATKKAGDSEERPSLRDLLRSKDDKPPDGE